MAPMASMSVQGPSSPFDLLLLRGSETQGVDIANIYFGFPQAPAGGAEIEQDRVAVPPQEDVGGLG